MDKTVIYEHRIWGHKLRGKAIISPGFAGDSEEPAYPTTVIIECLYVDGGFLDFCDAINPALFMELEETIAQDYDDNN